jgi:hypothetical protein
VGADLSFAAWLAIVALVVYFRLLRPVRLRASRLWLGPALMALLTALLAWGSYEGRVPTAAILLAIGAGAVLGVPFGLLRGRHTRVRRTGNPRVLLVEPSVVPLVIWFVAFAARFALRVFLPHAGPGALAASDGFLAFAVASLVGARLVIAQKFKELHAS